RDYGVPGQIGLEETPEEYVKKMVEVFREVRRVLRDDGTLWLNLGDSYATKPCGGIGSNAKVTATKKAIQKSAGIPQGLKPKDLVGIPWRVAFALQADGWYLRSDIIWHKPNAMPESVKDRPTKAHEYIFLLSKSPKYYYDADAIREPFSETSHPNFKGGKFGRSDSGIKAGVIGGSFERASCGRHPKGRNKRTVWSIPTKPFRGAHFAVFPPDLIEPCILAGAPEKACPHCGAPWVPVYRREYVGGKDDPNKENYKTPNGRYEVRTERGFGGTKSNRAQRIDILEGHKPTCQCENNDGSGRGVILDPFFGSGTTGVVAEKHGRQWIGIELNPDYIEIAKRRLAEGK